MAGDLPGRGRGELVAAGFVVDPVGGRRRRLGDHGAVRFGDLIPLADPAVALDGLEHLAGGTAHRNVVRVFLVVGVDGVQDLQAGLDFLRGQIGGQIGGAHCPNFTGCGEPGLTPVPGPRCSRIAWGRCLTGGSETPTAAAWTSATLSTDSRSSGQFSVAVLTASGTRRRLAAESARSASPGSGTSCPLDRTVIPESVTLKPRARSSSGSSPIAAPGRDLDVLVDDGAFDDGAFADVDLVHQDGVQHPAGRADVDVVGEHGAFHDAAGDDDAAGHDGIQGRAHRVGLAADELGRRGDALAGVDRPFGVVEVEDRNGGDEVHVGVVERVDGADVAPVGAVPFGGAGNVVQGEVVDAGLALVDEVGNDVPAHVVLGVEALGVDVQGFDEGVGVEDVVAHGGQELGGVGGEARGRGRLLDEGGNLLRVVLVHFDHTELVGHVQRLADGGDSGLGAAGDVLVHHLGEVHPVDVVCADDDDDVRVGVMDEVQGLVDGVGAAEEPALADALLRGDRGDVVAQLRGHPPRFGNVPVKAVGLVLRQDNDLQIAGIHKVRQGKVNEPVASGKRDTGFGPVRRQRHEPVSLATCEDNCQNSLLMRHGDRS